LHFFPILEHCVIFWFHDFFITIINSGKGNNLRKTRQKKIPVDGVKETVALKESKVNISKKRKNPNVNAKADNDNASAKNSKFDNSRKEEMKTFVQDSKQKAVVETKTADSKYDIAKIAKEINSRQTRQKQSSVENSEIVKKSNVGNNINNIKQEEMPDFEDSKTNSGKEINFRKTKQNKTTVEISKTVKKTKLRYH